MSVIEFKFKNINSLKNKVPIARVVLNDNELADQQEYWPHSPIVRSCFRAVTEMQEHNVLKIYFANKEDSDTVLDKDNNIVQDLNFELEQIIIDGFDVKDLIWNSQYVTKTEKIQSCLFFGPKGYFEFKFDMPVLKWILKTNHEKYNNDPNWEEDYNYYTEAWKLLDHI